MAERAVTEGVMVTVTVEILIEVTVTVEMTGQLPMLEPKPPVALWLAGETLTTPLVMGLRVMKTEDEEMEDGEHDPRTD